MHNLYTSGVEIEAFLALNDGSPTNVDAHPVFKKHVEAWLEENGLPMFTREPSSDTLELKTNAMEDDIVTPLTAIYNTKDIAEQHGLKLLFAGVNPQSNFETFELVDTPYFNQLTTEDFLQSVSCNTASIHVNLFLPEHQKELMFPLIYALQEWVWPVTAIMQSSPIYNGKFTNYMAGRQMLWDLIHSGRTGLVLEGLSSWEDFDIYRNQLLNDGIVDKVTKIWWDIRPKPVEGGYLIEVRFADTSGLDVTLDYIQIVSNIYQALIQELSSGQSVELFKSRLCLAQTRENILRHGRDAKLMLGLGCRSLSISEWSDEWLSGLSPEADELLQKNLENPTQAEKLLAQYRGR